MRDPKIDEECALLLGWRRVDIEECAMLLGWEQVDIGDTLLTDILGCWGTPGTPQIIKIAPDFSSGSEECKRNVRELVDKAVDEKPEEFYRIMRYERDKDFRTTLSFETHLFFHSKYWKERRDAARKALK